MTENHVTVWLVAIIVVVHLYCMTILSGLECCFVSCYCVKLNYVNIRVTQSATQQTV